MRRASRPHGRSLSPIAQKWLSSFDFCLSARSCWRSQAGGLRRHHVLVFWSRPAGLPAAGALPAADHDPGACRRRPAARRICDRAPHLRADPGDPEAGHRRLPVGRGQEFLQPSRRRPGLDPARRDHRCGQLRANRRPVGASTITQQVAKNMLLSNEISIDRKVKEILLATRIEAGAAEGPHPRALPERDLSRLRRLRRRRRRADLFRQIARRADPRRGRLSRRRCPRRRTATTRRASRKRPKRAATGSSTAWSRTARATRGARPPSQGRAARAAPAREEAERSRRLISPRRSGASCSPAMARRCFTGAGCRCAPASTRGCRRRPTRRCAPALIAYEHSHGGWRGAVARIDPKGDWAAHLAAVPVPPASRTMSAWRLAMVIRTEPDGAAIGLPTAASRAHPVLRDALGAAALRETAASARRPRGRRRCRQARRCRDGRADAGRGVEPRRAGRQDRRRSTRCARSRRSPAPLSRWTRIPAACSRSAAASASRRANSTAPPRPSGSRAPRSSRSSI